MHWIETNVPVRPTPALEEGGATREEEEEGKTDN